VTHPFDLTNKTVLVTGASRGIGAAASQALDELGARVVLHCGSDLDAAERVAAKLQNRPVVIRCRLGGAASGRELWRAALEAVGQIDVVVNNAGISPTVTVDSTDEEWDRHWAAVLAVNLVAVADICRMSIKHFETIGGGTIINVASRAAFRGDGPELMHYAASKAAVVALTRSIAANYGPSGVLAYVVAPGWVNTDMARSFIEEHPAAFDDTPLGQPTPPHEVGNTIAFLASGAATHLTGSTMDINGATYIR